jgi:hypothetical protein
MVTHQAVAMEANGQPIKALQRAGENADDHPITFLSGG